MLNDSTSGVETLFYGHSWYNRHVSSLVDIVCRYISIQQQNPSCSTACCVLVSTHSEISFNSNRYLPQHMCSTYVRTGNNTEYVSTTGDHSK